MSCKIDNVYLRGWLKKASGNMTVAIFTSMQPRYCLISRDDSTLYYYKSESDEVESGSIDLKDLHFARLCDPSRGCCKFEIKTSNDDRVFTFQARTNYEAKAWLEAISLARFGGPTKHIAPPETRALQGSNIRLSGYLNKQSNNKLVLTLQRRFVVITEADNRLAYYKSEADKEPLESLDLHDLEFARCVHGIDLPDHIDASSKRFQIKLKASDRIFSFEAASYVETVMWIDACSASPQTISHSVASKPIASCSPALSIVREGRLNKVSHNKYVRTLQKIQLRHVIITKEDHCLRYYKSRPSGQSAEELRSLALGECKLTSAEFMRLYDFSPTCRRFELGVAGGRVLLFECESADVVGDWMAAIENTMNDGAAYLASLEEDKRRALTPPCVLHYDDKGKAAFTALIRGEMDSFHARELKEIQKCKELATVKAESDTITESSEQVAAVTAAKKAWSGAWESDDDEEDAASSSAVRSNVAYFQCMFEYFNSFLPHLQTHDNHPARYDILCVFVQEFCQTLQGVLAPIFGRNSTELDNAQLQDIFAAIVLLSRLETRLDRIYCPVALSSQAPHTFQEQATSKRRSTFFDKSVKFNVEITNEIPSLCLRYANGSKKQDGVASFFKSHCIKVWKAIADAPEKNIKRHQDGSFFTTGPIDTWALMHQQLTISSSVPTPILHVLVAEKVGESLVVLAETVMGELGAFLASRHDCAAGDHDECRHGASSPSENDGSSEWKEIELEFLCGLTNDFALHIEEVLALICRFEDGEVRQQLDEFYDSVTERLVKAGSFCLDKIVDIIMSDIAAEGVFDRVFTEDWVEGYGEMESILVTLEDYLSDLGIFLMPFWEKKIVEKLLEAIVLHYTWSVLSKAPPIHVDHKSSVHALTGLRAAMGLSSSGGADKISNELTPVFATPETLGRLSRDINSLNAFFQRHVQESESIEILEIIRELLLMCQGETMKIAAHAISRIAQFPSSAQAIINFTQRCLLLRGHELDEDEFDECCRVMALSLSGARGLAVADARDEEDKNQSKHRLGFLFASLESLAELHISSPLTTSSGTSNTTISSSNIIADLVVASESVEAVLKSANSLSAPMPTPSTPSTGYSLAQRLRIMASIPLASLRTAIVHSVSSEGKARNDPSARSNVPSSSHNDDDDNDDDDDDFVIVLGHRSSSLQNVRGQSNNLPANTTFNLPEAPRAAESHIPALTGDASRLLTRRLSAPCKQRDLEAITAEFALLNKAQNAYQRDREATAAEIEAIEKNKLQKDREQALIAANASASGVLSLDGKLDKLCPKFSFPVWQNRYFKLSHRKNDATTNGGASGTARDGTYMLLWYKKKGGSVLKALNVTDELTGIRVVSTSRPLCYSTTLNKVCLQAEVDANSSMGSGLTLSVERITSSGDVVADPDSSSRSISRASTNVALSLSLATEAIEHFTFALYTTPKGGYKGGDEKVHFLRASTVDKIIRWINTLVAAGGLRYDDQSHSFVK